jgi:GT2 family glycosyltransferase
MSEEPFVSVIIPTYEREEVLCNTIKQLYSQTHKNFTVHIVDGTKNHSIETEEFLDSLPDRFFYHQLSEGGVSQARNHGLAVSDGDIIVFIDDDVTFDETFVSAHAESYTDPKIVGVAGQVLTPRRNEPIDEPPVGRTTWFGRSVMRLNSSRRGLVREGRGCNMSFRRRAIEAVGGFDEFLSFREETDLFCRIRKRTDGNILFNPDASVYHHEVDTGGTAFGSQQSRDELKRVTKFKSYFHLKNRSLITFPASVFSSMLFRTKQRKYCIHKLPKDIYVMLSAIKAAIKELK